MCVGRGDALGGAGGEEGAGGGGGFEGGAVEGFGGGQLEAFDVEVGGGVEEEGGDGQGEGGFGGHEGGVEAGHEGAGQDRGEAGAVREVVQLQLDREVAGGGVAVQEAVDLEELGGVHAALRSSLAWRRAATWSAGAP